MSLLTEKNTGLHPEHVDTKSRESPAAVQHKAAAQFRDLWKFKRSVLTALGCSTAPIIIGYDLTLMGSIIANREFVKKFGVFDENIGNLTLPASQQLVWTIVQYVAAIVTAFVAGQLNDVCGRRFFFFFTVG
ncbi:Putative major facilitator, sugar transporter, MFS transporter superfamily [Colletotrichum destructivum]|uniref:Major facilitator, sugar transporter, MFS transporter superfamily n=1 Tax=Colletotrichum destructivum TaxID=34406 RepID=A0AAX4IQM3_9PEZI|nr:Putative major facilitator, sugar transporter, MFS transporter superfamily [Colletotrichum destructivum]